MRHTGGYGWMKALISAVAVIIICDFAAANVQPAEIFGDCMVLQSGQAIPVWGWADAGEKVTVKLGEQEVSAVADANGNWMVKLGAIKAGGPYQMTISGKNTINFADIMGGEVWVCSGQSNMEIGIRAAEGNEPEIAAANWPNIRFFHVPKATAAYPSHRFGTNWKPGWTVVTPKSVAEGGWMGLTAVGYFFGRAIHKELNVPVGLISTSYGGTPIESWIPVCGYADVEKLKPIASQIAGADETYRKEVAQKVDEIDRWIKMSRKALAEGGKLPERPDWPVNALDKYDQPTGLYNKMINPLVPYAIRGAIWYQGEANVLKNDGMMYYEKMKGLIGGWRKVWGQGEFPFYYVQIAPFNYTNFFGTPAGYMPGIWEGQTASMAIPNTGMAVTVDIGNLKNIHPPKKRQVGERLALWALAKTYGRNGLVYSGPIYKSMTVEGDKARIIFEYTGSGLASSDGKELTWFEVAGTDKKFVKAKAVVDSNTVVVSADGVNKPIAVRFAWDQTASPNLINKEGLPAGPFRTDRW